MKTMAIRTTAGLAFAVIAAAAPVATFAQSDAASGTPSETAGIQTTSLPPLPAPAASGQLMQPPPAQGARTLFQLYGIARDYDATYHAAQAQVRASDAAAKQARGSLLPQIGLQADAGRSRVDASVAGMGSGGYSYSQSDEGLVATQPLYRPANRIAWDQSKRQLDTARTQFTGTEQDLVVRLAQAYFDVLAARDTLQYLYTLEDSVSKQLAMARRNFDIGNASITDSREAEARLALTTAQETAAENNLHVRRLYLDQLVGQTNVQPRPLAESVSLPMPDPQDADTWVARAQNSPAVRQARLALKVAQLEVDKAQAGRLPTVDLRASIGRAQFPNGSPTGGGPPGSGGRATGDGYVFPGYRTTTGFIGLQVNWPLFAGGALLERAREAEALKDKAQAQLDHAMRSSALATRAAYFTLQSDLGQIKALEAAETSSRTALEANQLGYKVGMRSNVDVLNAQSQLFETRRDLANVRYGALMDLLLLKQAVGILTPGDLARIDTLLAR